ncbi:hypothetical protein OH76DRAFT_276092 [Lentinus brumalis]|uniref:Uncharacterized protein n=1 Tax=Lentinus brumalis TaxID=2498619 RepID=A0A371CL25_9APHY|nr:hypothetical protein OH76DRAFT_276092 [Polyporus brumalis]
MARREKGVPRRAEGRWRTGRGRCGVQRHCGVALRSRSNIPRKVLPTERPPPSPTSATRTPPRALTRLPVVASGDAGLLAYLRAWQWLLDSSSATVLSDPRLQIASSLCQMPTASDQHPGRILQYLSLASLRGRSRSTLTFRSESS